MWILCVQWPCGLVFHPCSIGREFSGSDHLGVVIFKEHIGFVIFVLWCARYGNHVTCFFFLCIRDFHCGTSGGQQKRVSVGEVFTLRNPMAYFDGWSTGLDAVTALNIAKEMRAAVDSGLVKTVMCSQYQASQEVFELFDKVMVLQTPHDHGPARCVYFGPPTESVCAAYFASTGFPKPSRWSWPDFLGTLGNVGYEDCDINIITLESVCWRVCNGVW